jgi:hypothetical protein
VPSHHLNSSSKPWIRILPQLALLYKTIPDQYSLARQTRRNRRQITCRRRDPVAHSTSAQPQQTIPNKKNQGTNSQPAKAYPNQKASTLQADTKSSIAQPKNQDARSAGSRPFLCKSAFCRPYGQVRFVLRHVWRCGEASKASKASMHAVSTELAG